jgi:hypothetical protein
MRKQIYGGGDLNWSRIVPGTIRSFLKGEPPEIRSDGTTKRVLGCDWLRVELEEPAKVETALEREPLERRAREGQPCRLQVCEGYWRPMDTMRERGPSKKSGRAVSCHGRSGRSARELAESFPRRGELVP